MTDSDQVFLRQLRSCKLCLEGEKPLPQKPNPVFQFGRKARILIAGQAPGNLANRTSKPFNDPSGVRLRQWLGVNDAQFYNPELFSILPMGLCFPGYNPKGGDLPPRRECAPVWRSELLARLPELKMGILIGGYAMSWHLGERYPGNVTKTVESWRQFAPDYFPVPHPSWRNNAWLKRHSWFETELLPELQSKVASLLAGQ